VAPGSGEVGELWCRGPTVFNGYSALPEATAEAFAPGGWFKTGDLAETLENGYLMVVDRKKDMVRRAGYASGLGVSRCVTYSIAFTR
jgi:long-subunit acyl-CoA synthetase (AMP-forming)